MSSKAPSGHWYFCLKDPTAQIECAMFRTRAQFLDFRPENGQQVEVRARVTLYEPRGHFQLVVEEIRKAGLGALYEAFEKLKAKLQAEGLFEEERKRPLPAFPRAIGLVTYATSLLGSLEGSTINGRFSIRGTQQPPKNIVLVAIDDKSLTDINSWPYARTFYAQVLNNIAAEHPAAVAGTLEVVAVLTIDVEADDHDEGICELARLLQAHEAETILVAGPVGPNPGNDLPRENCGTGPASCTALSERSWPTQSPAT